MPIWLQAVCFSCSWFIWLRGGCFSWYWWPCSQHVVPLWLQAVCFWRVLFGPLLPTKLDAFIRDVVFHGCFGLHLEATRDGPDVRGRCGATCS